MRNYVLRTYYATFNSFGASLTFCVDVSEECKMPEIRRYVKNYLTNWVVTPEHWTLEKVEPLAPRDTDNFN
jgi:hypothetical protein